MAYRLQLPADSAIHPVFHISQLKAFHQDHTPVYSTLPAVTDLEATAAVPERILKCRLVKKGNNTVPQVLLTWTGFPASSATWKTTMSVKQNLRRYAAQRRRRTPIIYVIARV